MAKVLSISSQVVHGHVGNSITAFVLQRLGHEVLGLPTVILSNRPGYPAISGTRIAPETLEAILEAGAANGWLRDIDAIITGYLPTEEHAALCVRWLPRIKELNPSSIYLCDPILGDEPAGVYIDEAAAKAVRDTLLPLADLATPNIFELRWLTGAAIASLAEAADRARELGPASVVVTSAPSESSDMLANVLVTSGDVFTTTVARRKVLAHGTGDFFASFFLANVLAGKSLRRALENATAAMDAVLGLSEGQQELALVASQDVWAGAMPATVSAARLP